MIYFTADQHYGHTNIIKYCNRPFSSIEEMNRALIRNHNAVVSKNDIVYHLGDFSFRQHSHYLKDLNGRHILILGNHDRLKKKVTGLEEIYQVLRLKYRGEILWLSHYPHLSWPHSYHGSWHLFGHVHGREPGVGLSMDVGVDANNFTPVSFEQVTERMKNGKRAGV